MIVVRRQFSLPTSPLKDLDRTHPRRADGENPVLVTEDDVPGRGGQPTELHRYASFAAVRLCSGVGRPQGLDPDRTLPRANLSLTPPLLMMMMSPAHPLLTVSPAI